jgi:hypothetical protein
VRSFLYESYIAGLVIWVLYLCLHFEGSALGRIFHERNRVESVQQVNVSAAALLFTYCFISLAKQESEERWLAGVLASGMVWVTNRELDGFWEHYHFNTVYHILFVLTAIPAILIVASRPKLCFSQWLRRMREPAFIYLYVGLGLYAMGEAGGKLSREIGISREFKRVVEESLELLGGAYFVFAGVEAVRMFGGMGEEEETSHA